MQPDRIARTLASFANTRGCIILVDVMDNGQVSGIDSEEEKHMLELAANVYCNPPVKIFFKEVQTEDDKTVLKVIIPESVEKPHKVKMNEGDWRGYIRVKDKTVQTSDLVEQVLKIETEEKILPEFDLQETALIDYLKANRQITQKQFMKLVNISERSAYQILIRMVLHGAIRLHGKEKENYFTLS
jgi:predicted HTH transcriptional regulator